MKYDNPVIPGFYPDPSVCRVGADFYLVTSTFEYFPGVPVFKSRDLVHWEQIGHCLTRPKQLPLTGARSSGGIYAPTIRYHDGRFYVVTTNVTDEGHFFVWTDDPAGEWSDPIWVTFGDKPGFNSSIDSSLFFDDDGKVYFQCNHLQEGIFQFEIDIKTGEHRSETRHLWTGIGGGWPEAPHLYKIDGRYYLLIAEGGTHTGHMATIARSDTPWGPFESCPHNPILTHRSLFSRIQATGHAELFQAEDGSWWLVCLAIRWPDPPRFNARSHHIGRETFLAPVTWEEGWPVIGDGGRIELEMPVDHLPGNPAVVDQTPKATYDDFARSGLPLYWNFIRNPHADDWSLTEKPGTLTLHGSAVTLNDVASPAFIGRRQQHFNCVVSTTVCFDPDQENEEAGLTVLMNEHHHYEITITRRRGQRSVVFRQRIGPFLQAELACEPIGNGLVTLIVEATALTYHFRYAVADDRPRELGTGTVHHLSTEVAGGFTGVYFGMYATGNGRRSSTAAHFECFEYQPM